MKAVHFNEPGGPEVLQIADCPVPELKEGEVLIKVDAAGVNRPDLMQRLGEYPPPAGASSILGLEVAGRIVSVSHGRDRHLLGKTVCALVAGGGYAEYCAAPRGQCLPVPTPLTMIEAAALPEGFFTVWHNLFKCGGPTEGDVVLVHGGTSGIGTTAILLASVFRISVIITAGSDEKCDRALQIGASHAINYRTHDFVEEVRRITGGSGVSVVLDMVGGDYVARNIDCLSDSGVHVSIAAQRSGTADIPLWPIMRRRLTLTGSTLRPRSVSFKAELAAELLQLVWPSLEKGHIHPVIDSTFRLKEAAEAHYRMESSDHIGKLVLLP